MEKKLYEQYKDYFRVGAAVSGLFYDEEGFLKRMELMREHFKKFKKPAGMPDFKFPDPPKGPFPDGDILAKHFGLY